MPPCPNCCHRIAITSESPKPIRCPRCGLGLKVTARPSKVTSATGCPFAKNGIAG
jgi:ribosomal protein S27E